MFHQKSLFILGDGGVGKSTFTRILNTGVFKEEYITTIGFSLHEIELCTTHGNIKMNIYDTAGQEKFGSIRSDIYNKADAIIIMFDLTARCTYGSIPNWYKEIKSSIKKDIPIIILGNKLDLPRKVKSKQILFPKHNNLPYYEVSVKDQTNLEKPFNDILQQLYGDDTIECISSENVLEDDTE